MRRTLLAIALAVLVSTLFAPHHDHWSVLDGVRWKSSRHEAYYTQRRWNPFDQFDQVRPQTIIVTGHGFFDFPREMTPDQIRDVLRKKFPSDKEIVFAPPFDPSKPYEVISTPSPTPESEKPRQLSDEQVGGKPWLDWVTVYHPAEDIYYKPDWVDEWKWYPAFWPASSLLLTPFIAQTVFLATLALVLVNLRQKKSR